jgi:hypothetical protein
MTPKDLFRQPNYVAVGKHSRTRPICCPMCRETFYGYETIVNRNNRESDTPYNQPENKPDAIGYVTPRQTCGAWECYVAEERYAYRISPFFNERLREETEKDTLERPSGIKQIKGNYELF